MHRKQVMVRLHSRQRSQSHAVFSGAWPKWAGAERRSSFPTSFFLYHDWAQGGTLQPAHCWLILFIEAGGQAEVCHNHNPSCASFCIYERLYLLSCLWPVKQPLLGIHGHVESRNLKACNLLGLHISLVLYGCRQQRLQSSNPSMFLNEWIQWIHEWT